ncbi:MAG: hypothetical protein ACE5LU_04640 [Anaerolineae bacterium]
MQSGPEVFALLRTEYVPARVDPLHLQDQHDRFLQHYVLQESMDIERAVRYANAALCESYGLAHYYGVVFGELEEVYRP